MNDYRSSTRIAAVAFVMAGIAALVAGVHHRGLIAPGVALLMVALVWILLFVGAKHGEAPASNRAITGLARGSAVLAALLALIFLVAAL